MRTNLVITDNFYSNPDHVRNFALQQEFALQGNFPGKRTKSFLTQDVKDAVQSILWNAAGEITEWHDRDGLTGCYEIATSRDRSWIHTDHFNSWAGICYLTPNPPLTGGTGLFRHKRTGAERAADLNEEYDAQDMTMWEMTDRIGNKYNRLAFYRGDLFHTSLDYFGHDLYTGRLFQLFFITTQY